MPMTEAGIVQSGYASSTAETGTAGWTRPMNVSLTSTSTSSEFMSTRVHMPVRVKPPTDSGEIISPGCAWFSTSMPSNGARIVY